MDDTRCHFLPTFITSLRQRRLHHVTGSVFHKDVVEFTITVTPTTNEGFQAVVTRRQTYDVLTNVHRTAGKIACMPCVGSTDETTVIIVHIKTIGLSFVHDALEPLVLHLFIVQDELNVRSNVCAGLLLLIHCVFELVGIITVTTTDCTQPCLFIDRIFTCFVLDNFNAIVYEPWVVNYSREVLCPILVCLLGVEVVTTSICEFVEVLHTEVVWSSFFKVSWGTTIDFTKDAIVCILECGLTWIVCAFKQSLRFCEHK